jgi:hypothetical protein
VRQADNVEDAVGESLNLSPAWPHTVIALKLAGFYLFALLFGIGGLYALVDAMKSGCFRNRPDLTMKKNKTGPQSKS